MGEWERVPVDEGHLPEQVEFAIQHNLKYQPAFCPYLVAASKCGKSRYASNKWQQTMVIKILAIIHQMKVKFDGYFLDRRLPSGRLPSHTMYVSVVGNYDVRIYNIKLLIILHTHQVQLPSQHFYLLQVASSSDSQPCILWERSKDNTETSACSMVAIWMDYYIRDGGYHEHANIFFLKYCRRKWFILAGQPAVQLARHMQFSISTRNDQHC